MESYLIGRIEELIRWALTQDHPWPIAAIAKDHHALTVYCDLGGCLAIQPDGDVLCIPDDPGMPVHIETDPLQRNLAFVQASKRYPELADLFPTRPVDAQPCSECDGSGIHPITAHGGFEAFICRCGGTGWLPADKGPAS